jgi:hypothetical protein
MVVRKIDRPTVEVLGAGESTKGRLTTARVVGDDSINRPRCVGAGESINDRLTTALCSPSSITDRGWRCWVRPRVEPDLTQTGIGHWSILVVVLPLRDMYVGGCYVLKQHTCRGTVGVVDGSLSCFPLALHGPRVMGGQNLNTSQIVRGDQIRTGDIGGAWPSDQRLAVPSTCWSQGNLAEHLLGRASL